MPARIHPTGIAACVALACALSLVPVATSEAAAIAPTNIAASASFAPPANIDDQVQKATDYLAQASHAVNGARATLEQAARLLPAAQQKLTLAQAGVATAAAAAAQAQVAAAAARTAAIAAQLQVDQVQAEIAQLRIRIGALARDAYTSGGQYQELEILLAARSPNDFAIQLHSLKRMSRGNSLTLDNLAAAEKSLADKLAQLKHLQDLAQQAEKAAGARASDAASAQTVAAAAQQSVLAIVAQRTAALKTAARKRAGVKALYDQLRAEQQRIAREQKRRADLESGQGNTDDSSNSGGPIPTGTLAWPMPGYSADGTTGWRVHPVYGYRSCHTGVDVSAGYGIPIRAAAAGRVTMTGSGGPYGNNTLIDHGGGLSTMYAHQARIVVRVGARVTQGQVIGYIGSTGFSTGPHLHFEVHVNGTPYEPMGWFGSGSKRVVSCWSG